MSFDKAKVVRAAEKFLTQGKILPAITEYRKITAEEPGDFTALNMLGDLYVRVERKQEATECFSRIAEHYREQGFNLKAIAMFKKIQRLEPDNQDLAYQLATLYEAQGLAMDARTQYMSVADYYSGQGNVHKTLEILHRVADLDPHNVETRLKLAAGYQRENLKDRAAQAFTEAGEQLLSRGDYERALESLNHALEISTANYTAWSGIVTAYTALNAPDEAARALLAAGALESNDLELISLLAQAHLADENTAEAEKVAHLLLRVDPSGYTRLLEVARLYLKLNELDECLRALEAIVEPLLNARAETALIYVLDEVLARNPEHLGALHMLARVYKWQHDEEKLRTTLERVAEVGQMLELPDEERWALEQLNSLTLNNEQYRQRLRELSGEPAAAETAPPMPESEAALYDTLAGLTTGVAHTEEALGFDFSLPEDTPEIVVDPPADSSFAELSEEPPPPAATNGLDEHHAKALQQELESVDFYIGQDYYDIAQDTLEMLERQFGPQPNIAQRRAQLFSAQGLTPPDEAVPSASPQVVAEVAPEPPAETAFAENPETDATGHESGFFLFQKVDSLSNFTVDEAEDVMLVLDDDAPPATEFAAPADAAVAFTEGDAPAVAVSALDPGLMAIFDEFRVAVEEESQMPSDDDYETHYNLGLAYKEMELLDEAVEEFQIAAKLVTPHDGTPRHLHCCSLLGHCFMNKDLPRVAVSWFQKGLAASDLPEEAILALRYETALAYEQMGDLDKAVETFLEVYGVSVSYRGVNDKLRELQSALQPA